MPSPSSSISRQKDIFLAAQEIADVGERSRFIKEACGDDAGLLKRIEAMLESDAAPDNFQELNETLATSVAIPVAGDKVGYFGDYVLLDEIAHGSSGVVFRARQVSLDRVVALKMLRDRPLLTTEVDTRRLRAEATAAASLDHPNIVPIYEVGAHEGQPYFSMKLVEGGTLQFRIAEYQADPRKAAALMVKVARAVQHAHAKGILHRDLKPGNILIDAAGEPHITDFGLARKIGMESGLTMTGMAMGTPHYMSPEQARGGGRELTPATDIYSLGAILYELVEGRHVFQSEDLIELLKQVAEKAPPAPRTPHRDLAAIMMKCLEKRPTDRHPTAAALADDLEAWLNGKASVQPRRAIPWIKVVLATAACAAVAFALHAWWPAPRHVVTTAEDELDPPGTTSSGVSLREAVRDAAPGARITFDPSVFGRESKITLDATKGELVIEKNLELDASALPQGITLHSPQGGYRKLSIKAGAVVGVMRVTFTAEALASSIGSGQGGAINNEGTLTLHDCRFIKNGGGGNGGAIFTT
ncbi:MAG: serine/threonine-protein kinase, partial [Prosthecobacter sp.]|uniref:serine/threonine-protein kinase n=1 Tax=Prosthecobacter sp. TaxID=1965333 RepID=UPI003903C23F